MVDSSTGDRRPEKPVQIAADAAALEGVLVVPAGARGIVLFAHGSGSGRHSPRNRFVAGMLHEAGFATLLADLLTASEEAQDAQTLHLRFDIPFLGRRLAAATEWVRGAAEVRHLPTGYFGASTGAAAALLAAADRPDIAAIVSRGGRPDLTGAALARVRAPVLLIVGELDTTVLDLNREALEMLRATKDLAIVPSATHLFEEPGALEEVARLSAGWFQHHLG